MSQFDLRGWIPALATQAKRAADADILRDTGHARSHSGPRDLHCSACAPHWTRAPVTLPGRSDDRAMRSGRARTGARACTGTASPRAARAGPSAIRGLDCSRRGSATYATVHHSHRLVRRACAVQDRPRTCPRWRPPEGHVEGWREIVDSPASRAGVTGGYVRARARSSARVARPWALPRARAARSRRVGCVPGGILARSPARPVHGTMSAARDRREGSARQVGQSGGRFAMPSGAHRVRVGRGVLRADAERLAQPASSGGAARVAVRARPRARVPGDPTARTGDPPRGRYRVMVVGRVTPVSHLGSTGARRGRSRHRRWRETIPGALGDVLRSASGSVGRMQYQVSVRRVRRRAGDRV